MWVGLVDLTVKEGGGGSTLAANQAVQRIGASRFAHRQIKHQRRLALVADLRVEPAHHAPRIASHEANRLRGRARHDTDRGTLPARRGGDRPDRGSPKAGTPRICADHRGHDPDCDVYNPVGCLPRRQRVLSIRNEWPTGLGPAARWGYELAWALRSKHSQRPLGPGLRL